MSNHSAQVTKQSHEVQAQIQEAKLIVEGKRLIVIYIVAYRGGYDQ